MRGENAGVNNVNVNTCTSRGVVGIRVSQGASILAAEFGGRAQTRDPPRSIGPKVIIQGKHHRC